MIPRASWPAMLGLAVAAPALVFFPGGDGIESTFDAVKLLALAVATLLVVGRGGAPECGIDRVDVLAAAGLAAAMFSWLHAELPLRYGLEPLAAYGAWTVLFASLRRHARDPRRRAFLHTAMVVTAVGLAALALAEAAGAHLFAGVPRRPGSVLGNRNAVGAYMAVCCPLAVGLAARAEGRRARLTGLAVTALLAAVLVLTRCRAAWLGAVGAAAFALVALRARIALRPVAAIVVGVAIGAMPWPGLSWTSDASVVGTAARLADGARGSGQGRLAEAGVALRALAAAPLLGVGPRGWADARARFGHDGHGGHASPGVGREAPQSDLVRIGVETGLVGLACFAALGLVLLRGAPDRATAAALVAFAAPILLDGPLGRGEALALLAALAAIAAPASARPSLPRPRSLALVSARVAALALALAGVATGGARLAAARLSGPAATGRDLELADALAPSPRLRARIAASHDGDWARADEAAEHALALSPHAWGLLVYASQCADARGAHARARALLSRAYAVEPHLDRLRRSPIRRARRHRHEGDAVGARVVGRQRS